MRAPAAAKHLLPLLMMTPLLCLLPGRAGADEKKEPPPTPYGFRIHVGLTDTRAATWTVWAKPQDFEVEKMFGWHFSRSDSVTLSKSSAKCRTRARKLTSKQKKDDSVPKVYPIGLDVFVLGRKDQLFEAKASKASMAFELNDLTYGAPLVAENGKMSVQRIPALIDLTPEGLECDDVTIGADASRAAWVSWVQCGEDVQKLILTNVTKTAMAGTYEIAKSSTGFHRPIATVDGGGRVWVFFGMEVKGNIDIYARHMNAGQLMALEKVSDNPAPDIHHNVHRDGKGKIWVTWQSPRDGNYDIFLRHVDDATWSKEFRVTQTPENEWAPAACGDKDGVGYVTYDVYRGTDYDIAMRMFVNGKFRDPTWIARTPMDETHATLASDAKGRLWVAWEEGPGNWGRRYPAEGATPLHPDKTIRYKVIDTDGEKIAGALTKNFPYDLQTRNECPHLVVDSKGCVWMAFQHLAGTTARATDDGLVPYWEGYVTFCTGKGWQPPIPMPQSAGRRDQRPDLYIHKSGDVWLAWAGDGREFWRNEVLPGKSRIYAGLIQAPRGRDEPQVEPIAEETPAEAKPVAARRFHYDTMVGKDGYALLFGDLNRQTAHSVKARSGWGSYGDLFRCARDAAGLDFVVVADDFGEALRRVSWQRAQRAVKAHAVPLRFLSLFGYLRVHRFPIGSRVVAMASPDAAPIGLFYSDPKAKKVAEDDTKRLWDALKKGGEKGGGVTIPFVPAGQYGTNWGDADPAVQPVVELYSGMYGSFEQEGAPLVEMKGAKAEGFVANALAKKLKLGFVAGSGESSTGRAFTGVYVNEMTTKGILDALLARRTYAATDRIILEYRVGDHFMGEAFEVSGKPKFDVRIIGTDEIKQIDVIKNGTSIHKTDPEGSDIQYSFVDEKAEPGSQACYYVRIAQEDGAMAWASPVWITVK